MFVRMLYYFAGINILFRSHGLPIEKPSSEGHKMKEGDMHTCDVIRQYGYKCEQHDVTTEDGYILQLHRIPSSRNITNAPNAPNGTNVPNEPRTNVVFLQHGIIDSSYTWVVNYPNESLAYILADQGFDVWMGNTRGNTYSRRHKIYDESTEEFWNFTWDEMARHDLPASINYALEYTKQSQLNYVGHAQGTLIGFASFIMYPSLGKKIKLFAALAPTSHVSHVKGLLRILSYGTVIGEHILGALGNRNFMPPPWATKAAAKILCNGRGGWFDYLCGSLVFLIAGYDVSNLHRNRIPLILEHTPAGTSVKNIIHFSQMIQSNKLQRYDYKWNGNMHRYMQPTPPEYDIETMDVPIALFSGLSDWLATPLDIDNYLRPLLPNIIYDQIDHHWNHVDFVWGKNANTVIYNNLISLLNGKQPTTAPNALNKTHVKMDL